MYHCSWVLHLLYRDEQRSVRAGQALKPQVASWPVDASWNCDHSFGDQRRPSVDPLENSVTGLSLQVDLTGVLRFVKCCGPQHSKTSGNGLSFRRRSEAINAFGTESRAREAGSLQKTT